MTSVKLYIRLTTTGTLFNNHFDNCLLYNYTYQHLCLLQYSTTHTSLRPLPSTMAQLLRTTKPGGEWTANELAAYNITAASQNKEEFFGTTNFS